MQIERGHYIHEQNEREPSQYAREQNVAKANCCPTNTDTSNHDPDMRADVRQQRHCVGHSREIGADVDRVCDEERAACDCQNSARKLFRRAVAKPVPVTIPIRAHIDCTAAMSGHVMSEVQRRAVPSCAPAIE